MFPSGSPLFPYGPPLFLLNPVIGPRQQTYKQAHQQAPCQSPAWPVHPLHHIARAQGIFEAPESPEGEAYLEYIYGMQDRLMEEALCGNPGAREAFWSLPSWREWKACRAAERGLWGVGGGSGGGADANADAGVDAGGDDEAAAGSGGGDGAART